MIAVDTNILVYSYRDELPEHEAAWNCMRLLSESRATWAVPWPCIHEFLGVVTNPRIFRIPSPMAHAIAQVDVWLESPSFTLIGETTAHWLYLKQTLTAANVVGPKTHEARIAAICRQHGVSTLFSVDRDFSRFPELRTVNPLKN